MNLKILTYGTEEFARIKSIQNGATAPVSELVGWS